VSVRWKLTLSYAAFLVIAGAGLLAALFYILRFVPEGNLNDDGIYVPDRGDLVSALLPRAWQVLGVLAVVGLVGGWFIAGRILRPVRRINAVAQAVAAGSLAPRVRLDGPRDEFRQLAESFDDMLDRLERTFDEQRRFAANASHELRTPYAIERAMIDVALTDPDAQDIRELLARLDVTNRRGTETVEALLTLSRLDQGQLPPFEPIDITELIQDVTDRLRPLADAAGVTITIGLSEGDIDGSPALVRQLVTNVVLNAIRHNEAGGTVGVSTLTAPDGEVTFTVSNSGPIVPQSVIPRLTEPFVRAGGRVASGDGSGLGLAIVARVAQVHNAALRIDPRVSGGLRVRVIFVAPPGLTR
jgi:two-component system, OmpR family, sensor histidine kinase VanS